MPVNQLSKYRHIFIAIALFCLAFLLYSRSQYRSLMDSKWAIHIASSMINSGDINMDEYEPIVSDNHYSGTTRTSVEGQLLPYFPIGNSILIIPLVWIINICNKHPHTILICYPYKILPHHLSPPWLHPFCIALDGNSLIIPLPSWASSFLHLPHPPIQLPAVYSGSMAHLC